MLTSHAGSLPRPEELLALNHQRRAGDGLFPGEPEYLARLRAAVADVVDVQQDTGLDLVNDGEYGRPMGSRYDYGAWWT
jgi:5-methyltetrahydropteroyltriglutamate--homocysteine methyltransferase